MGSQGLGFLSNQLLRLILAMNDPLTHEGSAGPNITNLGYGSAGLSGGKTLNTAKEFPKWVSLSPKITGINIK